VTRAALNTKKKHFLKWEWLYSTHISLPLSSINSAPYFPPPPIPTQNGVFEWGRVYSKAGGPIALHLYSLSWCTLHMAVFFFNDLLVWPSTLFFCMSCHFLCHAEQSFSALCFFAPRSHFLDHQESVLPFPTLACTWTWRQPSMLPPKGEGRNKVC